jgi:predicted chitinase
MKPLVSVDELRKLMPRLSLARAGLYAPLLSAAMEEHDITTKKRRCAFLAQLAHESVELRYMEEIASGAAYEGRADLGNTQPGDGKRYKGRGPIQLTGRANYRRFGRLLGLDLEGQPKLAAVPEHGFRIAALFWKLGGLNELADKLSMKGDQAERGIFMRITKRINGGHNGLNDRLNYFRIAKQVLHNDDDQDPSSPQSPVAPPAVRPAESVHEQESAEGQAASPAIVSAEPESDLLGAAVKSEVVKKAAPKLWPRLSGLGVYLFTLYQTNQIIGNILIVIVLAGVGCLVYWKWSQIKIQLRKLLQ